MINIEVITIMEEGPTLKKSIDVITILKNI